MGRPRPEKSGMGVLRGLLWLVGLGVIACAPSGTIRFEPESVSVDGLVKVRTHRLDGVYLKPGARVGDYAQVLVEPVVIRYRRDRTRPKRGEYVLGPAEQQRIVELFQQEFEAELARSTAFVVVDEPGPDVLRVRASLLDLVVTEPPQAAPRERVFVQESGAMTLLLDVRDSQTGEALARFADRRAIEPGAGFYLAESNPVSNTTGVRRVFRDWARFLRDGLDRLHALPEIPAPPSGEEPPAAPPGPGLTVSTVL